jgi:hypothetical protein
MAGLILRAIVRTMSSLTDRYHCRALDLFAAAPMYEVPEALFATTERIATPIRGSDNLHFATL